MADIKFSPEAINDLRQIKAYIKDELCNEQAALSTIARIMEHINRLGRFHMRFIGETTKYKVLPPEFLTDKFLWYLEQRRLVG